MPAPTSAKPGSLRAEQIILFRVGEQLFALSSSSVQEVRSADSLSGGAKKIAAPGVDKVREFVRRGQNTLFIVSGATHFGRPEGFLSDDELMMLDAALPPPELSNDEAETEVDQDTDLGTELH
jgi:hypothetical protein